MPAVFGFIVTYK